MRPLIALLSIAAVGCHLISGLDEPIHTPGVSSVSSGPGNGGSAGMGGGGSCSVGGQVASDYRDEVLADAPLGYWRLSDAGDDAADEVGCTIGEYVGNVTQRQPGALQGDSDTAAQFDGPNAAVRFVDIFDLPEFSIEVWINIRSGALPDYHWILSKMTLNRSLEPIEGYGLYYHPQLGLSLDIARGAMHVSAEAPTLVLDTWHHVVATFDGADGHLYVNGQNIDSLIASAPPMDHDGVFVIGALDDTGGGAFLGGLDEVAIYDQALSAARVLAHYTAGTN